MPSKIAIEQRRRDAIARVNDQLDQLARILDIALDPIVVTGPASRNPDMRETLQTEQASAALDQIINAITHPAELVAVEPGDDPVGLIGPADPDAPSVDTDPDTPDEDDGHGAPEPATPDPPKPARRPSTRSRSRS